MYTTFQILNYYKKSINQTIHKSIQTSTKAGQASTSLVLTILVLPLGRPLLGLFSSREDNIQSDLCLHMMAVLEFINRSFCGWKIICIFCNAKFLFPTNQTASHLLKDSPLNGVSSAYILQRPDVFGEFASRCMTVLEPGFMESIAIFQFALGTSNVPYKINII